MAIGPTTCVANGTLDLDFGLKTASDLKSDLISFELVLCSVCRASLVMIGAVLGMNKVRKIYLLQEKSSFPVSSWLNSSDHG